MRKPSEPSPDKPVTLPLWKRRSIRAFLWLAGFILVLYGARHLLNSLANPYETVYEATWSTAGLDPSALNFVPQVIILAGTVTQELSDGHSITKPEVDEFEITMRGYDNYHRAEWKNGRAARWRIVLFTGRFWSDTGMKKTGTGHTRIGMGGGFSSNDWFSVARRLWDGTNFVGAMSESIFRPGVVDEFSEQFLDVKEYGRFKVPHTILYAGWPDGNVRTYHVKKVTFRTDPETSWFVRERDRLFPEAPAREAEFARSATNFLRLR